MICQNCLVFLRFSLSPSLFFSSFSHFFSFSPRQLCSVCILKSNRSSRCPFSLSRSLSHFFFFFFYTLISSVDVNESTSADYHKTIEIIECRLDFFFLLLLLLTNAFRSNIFDDRRNQTKLVHICREIIQTICRCFSNHICRDSIMINIIIKVECKFEEEIESNLLQLLFI